MAPTAVSDDQPTQNAARPLTTRPHEITTNDERQSLYRRSLPEPSVAFSSRSGKSCFESAMRNRGTKSFFRLIEQHSTQSEPAFCGLSSLMISLNALAVDPEKTWKGPWRWYDETMLNCCLCLDEVKKTGITLHTFVCLAICQGLEVNTKYVEEELVTIDSFRQTVKDVCVDDHEERDTDETFDRVLIVSYDRAVLGQTGSGHFSPIAAYDSESDFVLVMDTARFKYGSHWVPLELLFKAMEPIDEDTGRSRGFVVLINRSADRENSSTVSSLPVSLVLRSDLNQTKARRELKHFLQSLDSISYTDVYDFCTRNGPDSVWQYVAPQLKPNNFDTAKLVWEVRQLVRNLADASELVPLESNHCASSRCRVQPVTAEEAAFIIYLASMSDEERRILVQSSVSSEEAKQQLLDEAALGSYAIQASDQFET